jgi:monofunctional glycosyltransferase
MTGRSARPAVVRIFKAVAVVIVLIVIVPYLLTPLYRFVDPVSTLMLYRRVTGARVEHTWVPLTAISPALPRAVLSAEDARFCTHHGIDFGELRNAIGDADDLSEMRGGSTITQQTAKNLFLWQGRSVVRKVLEFPLALWIDLVLGKRRTLEIYLNIAEWGPNGEFGAEAAARHAFGKSVRDLNEREAALMAAILPNPRRRSAQKPGPGVRRLGGIYQSRVAKSAGLTDCLRR